MGGVVGARRTVERRLAAALVPLLLSPATAAAAPVPACPAGTPSAERLAGLPGRIEFGPSELFRLAPGSRRHAVAGRIRVRMVSDGRTFFSGTTRDRRARFFVNLDLGDGPATITASFTQVAERAPYALPCRMTVRRTVRGFRRFRLNGLCGPGGERVRPRFIVLACGDGNLQLRRLRWRKWNRARATAVGAVMANDCVPYCAAGRFHFTPTRVVAFRPRGGGGRRYLYTRLRFRHQGRWSTLRLRNGYWG